MDRSNIDISMLPGAITVRVYRFVRGLTIMYSGFAALTLLLLALALLPGDAVVRTRTLLLDALHGGLAALLTTFSLMTATVLSVALLDVFARQHLTLEANKTEGLDSNQETPNPKARHLPGIFVRWGQAIVLSAGTLIIIALCFTFSHLLTFEPLSPDSNLAAGFAILIAFLSLIAERIMNSFPASQMPEAPSLRRVLLLATITLTLAGCLEIGHGMGFSWLQWPTRVLVWLPALVLAELALKALFRLFVPASTDIVRVATDSILLTLITAGPRAPGVLLREHLGMDFTRSWALGYLRSAALPAIFITALFCWGLSGLKLVPYDGRGVYERLGAPVSVLGPGLHLLLPWPLSHLRPVEFGAVHTVIAGLNREFSTIDHIAAEATAPAGMNRLWETVNPTEVGYLIASQNNSQQGFQAVSAEIRVLYRIGLTDQDALESVYGTVDQDSLVKMSASRLATLYFASHALEDVMGARRDTLEEVMRENLARDLGSKNAGIDVVAVVIEAIHPPAGAAEAYHAVQAAEINADASVSDEMARAEHTLGIAQQEARRILDTAQASAVDIVQQADADAYRFGTDVRSSALSPASFLLERRFEDLTSAFATRHLIIVDHALTPAQEPIIDMRPPGLSKLLPAEGVSTSTSSPRPVIPGTSTEGVPPPLTTEDADEEARQAKKAGSISNYSSSFRTTPNSSNP